MFVRKPVPGDGNNIYNVIISATEALENEPKYKFWLDTLYAQEVVETRILSEHVFIAAGKEGQVVGSAFLNPTTGYFSGWYVKPGFHNKGLGVKLLDAVLSAADSNTRIYCSVRKQYRKPISILERYNFTVIEDDLDGTFFPHSEWFIMKTPEFGTT